MNILVVCQYYAPEPFRIADICESLVERGHRVTVVTGTPNYPEGEIYPGYGGGAHRNETIRGVRIHRCPIVPRKQGALRRFLNYYSFVLSAGAWLRKDREDYDVVFVNQLSPVMMAQPALNWAGRHHKKCVLYCLDLWPESLTAGGISRSSLIYRLFLGISRRIYRRAQAIAVSSQGFIPYFEETLGLDGEKIRHIPQYAEELFDHLPEPAGKKETVNFVFAGNVGVTQSVETIIEAAALLQDHPEIRFHIVGSGISLDHCRELAGNLNNVTFYGRRPLEEMPAFYAMADAMLITLVDNPSMAVTLPGKVQSYMAAGKPIIGSTGGETARVIRESQCGECVKPEDGQALSQAILRMAEDPEERERRGKNSRLYYETHFKKEVFLQSLEKLLEENC